MAFSKPLALLLLLLLASTAMSGAGNCQKNKKITVQNLSGTDVSPVAKPVAQSEQIFPPGFVLRHGTHVEFMVCEWSGAVSVPGADASLHVAPNGASWYKASNHQTGGVRVTVTPHSSAHGVLHGHCPTVGCREHGWCSAEDAAGSNCGNVDELKVIYHSGY